MNKIKIKPYLKELIKENILYIAFSFGFLILIIFLVQSIFVKISTIDLQYQKTSNEVNELKTRYDLLNTAVPSTSELEQDIKLLNTLIPNSEDYFSIIYALDKLSQDTGFIITSYTVNMNASTNNKLSLTVGGVGDTTKFFDFLKNYNFSGGRLITSNNIELDAQTSDQTKIDLTFYNKKVDLNYNQNVPINQKIFQDITTLKSKINFDFTDQSATESANTDTSYPTKDNPF